MLITMKELLCKLTKKKVVTKMTNFRNKRGAISTEPLSIKRIIKEYYVQFYDRSSITSVKCVRSLKDTLPKVTIES